MSHYDIEMGVRPVRPPKRTLRKPTPTQATRIATGGIRKRPPSAGGNVAERYEAAIAAYGSGATWDETITYWGTALYSSEYDLSEMDECAVDDSLVDEIADKIRADVDERGEGVRQDRVADVRRSVVSALRKQIVRAREWRENGGRTFTPRARKPTPPPQHTRHVRNLIGDMPTADGCKDWVRELSPCLDWIGKPPQTQTALFLRAAFRPGEVLHVFRDDVPTAGIFGANVRPAADWVEIVDRGGKLSGDLIVPNPFTGEQGTTTAGKPSYIAQSCLAAFPFVVLEMDDAKYAFGGDVSKGLAMQCAFWRGFILTSNLAPALVSLTYSGGKSIHGLLHVGAATLDEWQRTRARLAELFASDTEAVIAADGCTRYPFRVDVDAMKPRQGTRIAGVRRFDNGRRQVLLYLNPNARAGNMWREPVAPPPPPINPNGKPPCGTAFGKGMCSVCVRLPDCPLADPDAVPGRTLKGDATAKVSNVVNAHGKAAKTPAGAFLAADDKPQAQGTANAARGIVEGPVGTLPAIFPFAPSGRNPY